MCVSVQNPLRCSLEGRDGRIGGGLRPVFGVSMIDEDRPGDARRFARGDIFPAIADQIRRWKIDLVLARSARQQAR
jgi:hypothetical protein